MDDAWRKIYTYSFFFLQMSTFFFVNISRFVLKLSLSKELFNFRWKGKKELGQLSYSTDSRNTSLASIQHKERRKRNIILRYTFYLITANSRLSAIWLVKWERVTENWDNLQNFKKTLIPQLKVTLIFEFQVVNSITNILTTASGGAKTFP